MPGSHGTSEDCPLVGTLIEKMKIRSVTSPEAHGEVPDYEGVSL